MSDVRNIAGCLLVTYGMSLVVVELCTECRWLSMSDVHNVAGCYQVKYGMSLVADEWRTKYRKLSMIDVRNATSCPWMTYSMSLFFTNYSGYTTNKTDGHVTPDIHRNTHQSISFFFKLTTVFFSCIWNKFLNIFLVSLKYFCYWAKVNKEQWMTR